MNFAKEILETFYLNKIVRVTIDDPYSPVKDKEGVVTYVDDALRIHGTWSSLAVIPGVDEIEIVEI